MSDEQATCERITARLAAVTARGGHSYADVAVEFRPASVRENEPFVAVVYELDEELLRRGTRVGIYATGETCADALLALECEVTTDLASKESGR